MLYLVVQNVEVVIRKAKGRKQKAQGLGSVTLKIAVKLKRKGGADSEEVKR
jgi:hypothetical protein